MDSNRLQLNFGTNNERLAPSDRTYPTTPSTFPQPVFPSSSQQHASAQLAQPAQAYSGGYAPANSYFAQGQYQSQYAPHQAIDYAGAAQPVPYQPRSNTPGTNDPNVGLAHQFSHQNLGGAARGNAHGARGPSPAQLRPRTAGSTGQQPLHGYPAVPVSSLTTRPSEFQQAPERNPEKYGTTASNNQKKCSQLAADFFKDSVKRARERNLR